MVDRGLSKLEESITEVVERLKLTETENNSLKQEIRRLTTKLEELERESRGTQARLTRFEHERERLRAHLERMRQHLAILEKPVGGANS